MFFAQAPVSRLSSISDTSQSLCLRAGLFEALDRFLFLLFSSFPSMIFLSPHCLVSSLSRYQNNNHCLVPDLFFFCFRSTTMSCLPARASAVLYEMVGPVRCSSSCPPATVANHETPSPENNSVAVSMTPSPVENVHVGWADLFANNNHCLVPDLFLFPVSVYSSVLGNFLAFKLVLETNKPIREVRSDSLAACVFFARQVFFFLPASNSYSPRTGNSPGEYLGLYWRFRVYVYLTFPCVCERALGQNSAHSNMRSFGEYGVPNPVLSI